MKLRQKYGITKYDIMLAVVFIMAAAACLFWSAAYYGDTGGTVELRQNGELIGSYPLDEDRQIPVESNGYTNLIVIENSAVRMEEATCPDQYCVLHAPVSHVHETIVCLPARLVVEITDGEESGLDAVSN